MLVWMWITFSITCDINSNKSASVNEPFLDIDFSFAILQEAGNFPEVLERLHKSVIGLAKTLAPSFKKRPDRLSKRVALDTLVFLKIVKMVFSETVTRLKESLWIMPL